MASRPHSATRSTERRLALLVAGALALSACASPAFISSQKAPDAALLQLDGEKIAAVVMTSDESMRREAEDALARQIDARGAQGIPGYTVLPEQPSKEREAQAKAAFERAGVRAVVVMRPIAVEKDVTADPLTFTAPASSSFWGGYYGEAAYSMPVGGEVHTKTTVTIETRVYSLVQNKLVWTGQSRTTDPHDVSAVMKRLSVATAQELRKQGLLR